MATSEKFADQMERLHMMSMDDCGETWDLSAADCAAVKAVLDSHDRLMEALKLSAEWSGAFHIAPCPQDDTCDCAGKPVNDKINEAYKRGAEGYR